MNFIKEMIEMAIDRKFSGPNPLPLGTSLLSIFLIINPTRNLMLCQIVGFILPRYLTCIDLKKKKRIDKFLSVIFFLFSICTFTKKTTFNTYIAEFLVYLIYKKLIEKNQLSAIVLLSLLALTHSIYLPIIFSIFILYSIDAYKKLINPMYSVKRTLFKQTFNIILTVILPKLVFSLSLAIYLIFKNIHSEASLDFSIKFQAGQRNFEVTQGFINSHKPTDNPSQTDLYVMDRSIISIINKKHKAFFSLDDAVDGSKEFVDFAEIHKIHSEDFDDEEPRFIKDGDLVKFKYLSEDKFIGMKRDEPEDKFVDLELGLYENEEDLWKVSCDGYLKSRSTEVMFINTNTGDPLCARMIKDKPVMNASYYSDPASRYFYIAASNNHEYYKMYFKDERARMVINNFEKPKISQLILEYVKAIDLKFTSNLEVANCGVYRLLASIFLGLFFLGILILNDICYRRWKSSVRVSRKTGILALKTFLVFLFYPFIGYSPDIMFFISIFGIYNFIKDFIETFNGKVNLEEEYKKLE